MPAADSSVRLTRPVWIAAALGALALHAGGIALAFASLQADESDQDLGAPAIEIGVELTTSRINPTGLPVGPDSEASVASPARVEQEKQVQETDLPKAAPMETEDPERVVALDSPKEPKEEEPKPAAQDSRAATATAAAEETAMPAVDNAALAPRSAAPALGTGDTLRRDVVTWQKELAAHFNKHKTYPADRSMQNAEVLVSFVLDRTGHIVTAAIVKGSGDPSFDAAALAMLKRADPVPAPPALMADQGLAFSLPVIFQVKGKR